MTEPDRRDRSNAPRCRRHRTVRPQAFAIVGMGCRFPGARNLDAFWTNLLQGKDCTSEVPRSRWNPDEGEARGLASRRGGFLDEPIAFDPTRYGVMPLAVAGGEPEQYLIMDATCDALEDAGIKEGTTRGDRVSVVIGRGNYFNRGNLTRLQHGRVLSQTLAILRQLHPDWSAEQLESVRNDLRSPLPPFEGGTVGAQITNSTASRVADRFNFSGPAFVVDAASASSLVALDVAIKSLATHESDLAIVGGVYLASDHDFYQIFTLLGALSPTGKARPFAREADGLVPGEGAGVVILKRLRDAERDGDRIYSVLKGLGLSSDGRASGLAAPSARGHVRAMRRAYRRASIDPRTVGLIEGHGLGVPASDRAELRALNAVFPAPEHGRRPLGAVSALIGHAMPAAGIAALIKASLALYHRVIPPSPGSGTPHALLSDGPGGFEWVGAPRPWIHGDTHVPRRAGVNAFGFAGINAHAVLEEHRSRIECDRPGAVADWDSEAILLGAHDRPGALQLVKALRSWLESGANARANLKDLAATLNLGQSAFSFRLGLVARSTTALIDLLRSAESALLDPKIRSIRDAQGFYFFEDQDPPENRLAFLFPGEGSQYSGMLADLCLQFPEVRRGLDNSDRIARDRGLARLPSEQLYGRMPEDETSLWSVGTAVNVVLSTHWALHALLRTLGITPNAVVGHSSGEFLALASAGVFEIDDTFADRLGDLGVVFESLEREGRVPSSSLVAIAADRGRVERVLSEQGLGADVSVAIDNCPHQVVVACRPAATERLLESLKGRKLFSEALPFDRAYHTAAFTEAIGPIRTFFDGVTFHTPRTRIYSCLSGTVMPAEPEAIRRLAIDQWASPVEFRRTIEAMYADGIRDFVEVGARGSLTGYVEDILRGRPHFAMSVNAQRRSGITQLNHLVAALYARGIPLRPDALYARRRPQRIDLGSDLPAPGAIPSLDVGFPEMRLSQGLVDKLTQPAKADYVPLELRPSSPPPVRKHALAVSTNGHGSSSAYGTNGESSSTQSPIKNANANGHHRPAASATSRNGSAASVEDYFRTMDVFLDVQREVMAAYLDGRGASALEGFHRNNAPVGAPTTNGHKAEPELSAIPVELPRTEPPPASGDTPAPDLAKLLLELVSKRTGYPLSILNPALDMEGDLGIDSIKRVEILGELQGLGHIPDGTDLDKLSRARTLADLIESLERSSVANASATVTRDRWTGPVVRYSPGREFEGLWILNGSTDPIAREHTLGGRRVSRTDPERLGLPVLPFTVMVEILNQAAAVLLPDKVVIAVEGVSANRWIPYPEEGTSELQVHAKREDTPSDRVLVKILSRPNGEGRAAGVILVEGTVAFGDHRPPPPPARDYQLADATPTRYRAREFYDDQWLFHGPGLQSMTELVGASRSGIHGTLRVLPREPLFPGSQWCGLHTDPIVLDAYTHILGAWGIDQRAGVEGDVMFPLRVDSIAMFGDDPEVGTEVDCRITVTEVTRHKVGAQAEIVRPDGRVWVRISGWEDWRFYWPPQFRDVFRKPGSILICEPIDTNAMGLPGSLVWLEPPIDMGKPVWRNVLEWVQTTPVERRRNRAKGGGETALTARIWERVAAKEATRRLWAETGGPDLNPADFSLDPEDTADPPLPLPALATISNEVAAAAFASAEGRPGLALIPIHGSANFPMNQAELGWLGALLVPETAQEWRARLWAARSAAANASGLPLDRLCFVSADPATGLVEFQIQTEADESAPTLRAGTWARGEFALGWSLATRFQP